MTIGRAELVNPDRHIFLSPHYDDIALSAGGTAAELTAAGRTPEVALIFGEQPDSHQPLTEFAESLHRAWGMSAEEVVSGRRKEENVASIALGTCDRFLPFRDAIYRGNRYQSDEELFGPIKPDEAGLKDEIIQALRLCEGGTANTRIYAPLAIGFHVDHQHAFRAGMQLADQGYEVWFYEDLPYGLKPDHVSARREQIEHDGLAPGPVVEVSSQWTRKIDAIMAYPSQLKTIFGQYVGIESTRAAIDDAMAQYARAAGDGVLAERFWSRHE
jgi:LmbE family N-acetylglucosaminyl deacetylase